MSIVRPTLALLAICLPCVLPAAWAAETGAKESVTVTLQGTKGEPVGEAVLTETPHGVATLVRLTCGSPRKLHAPRVRGAEITGRGRRASGT